MDFAEMVAQLSGGVEKIGDVNEFAASLQAEHERELGIRQAKIETMTGDLTKVRDELKETKATNYDLIMKKPATSGNGDPVDPPVDPPKPTGTKSLFKPKEA